jgi:hypothetical protein
MGPKMGWAGWLGPTLTQFVASFVGGASGTFTLLHVGPWRQFLPSLNRAPCYASFKFFCPDHWSFLPS